MKFVIFLIAMTASAAGFAAAKMPPGHPPVNADGSKAPPPSAQKATVIDVINVAQYTYLEVEQEQQSLWIAGPSVEVRKGDVVRFDGGVAMKDFHSKTLDRTFPSIVFVNRVVVGEK
ncbi:hypothetical protein [Methylococcus geothermalis]|uniref:NrfJ-related protein n=1 Tax=Methylococcus geothermalis TaxID=2681310 RepID=A0A858Q4H9_9GAMM|nr:hypothetical protein [Methylococcus geothermalis]QJD28731.1 hypothetical protein GNH96_01275 [Methylococcus geothermalis]